MPALADAIESQNSLPIKMKPLYKQTGLGVIPEDGEVKSLRDFTTIAIGITPPTSETYVAPHLPAQYPIATILSDMDAEIAVLKKHRNKTCDLKQAMMQELLTRKTRLL